LNIKFKRTGFFKNRIFCNIINIFTVTFDLFNESLMRESSFKKIFQIF